jgi:putative addiction module component (TIGR02574 family)
MKLTKPRDVRPLSKHRVRGFAAYCDRVELAIALWESLSDSEREGAFELTDAQRTELDRRWAEDLENPRSAIPWSEVRASCWAERDAASGLQARGRRRSA